MRLAKWLGLKNGLNTYRNLIDVIEQEMEDPRFNNLADNRMVTRYFEKAAADENGNSSFSGEMGKRNLVATLGDIFMGGKKREFEMSSQYHKKICFQAQTQQIISWNGLCFI